MLKFNCEYDFLDHLRHGAQAEGMAGCKQTMTCLFWATGSDGRIRYTHQGMDVLHSKILSDFILDRLRNQTAYHYELFDPIIREGSD